MSKNLIISEHIIIRSEEVAMISREGKFVCVIMRGNASAQRIEHETEEEATAYFKMLKAGMLLECKVI